jgi:tripartite-type tricarboxylate transporter receptor subunit TctC
MVGKNLSEKWGIPVVVDNRPGAGGNLGAELAAKSPPDGYTLFLSSIATHAINPALYKKPSFDPTKDFEPVILLATTPNVMVVGKAVPANTVEELIELAQQAPKRRRETALTHLTGAFQLRCGSQNFTHSLSWQSSSVCRRDQ